MLYAVIVVLLVVVDQIVKVLVRSNLALGGTGPLHPPSFGFNLCAEHRRGLFPVSEHTWLLTVVSAVMALLLAVAIVKKFFRHPAGQIILSVVLAGAVGNLIDRAIFGYVTDMFATSFMNFAVFNVADICVVLGGIALCVYVLFFHEKLEEKEPEHGDTKSHS
ncbi:MAG: signal peptidase II [Oscillospiraceae bacterium]